MFRRENPVFKRVLLVVDAAKSPLVLRLARVVICQILFDATSVRAVWPSAGFRGSGGRAVRSLLCARSISSSNW